jgi:D-lactate dehydrogenase
MKQKKGNPMAKIVFFGVWPEMQGYIKRKLRNHRLLFLDRIDSENLKQASQAQIVGTRIYSQIAAPQISQMPSLKMIATFSTGFDHIDIDYCSKKGIAVCNIPSYGSHTVAEHSIALMMALAKKIVLSVERTRKGVFSLEGLRTFDILDKTLGIVGFGKIGIHVARIARALGMNILVFDPFADRDSLKNMHCKAVSLEHLLKKSDIISLHAPLTAQTRHIIDKKALAKTKKGVLIINTARGGLIDTQALVHAIIAGHVGGAGLDVLEEEKAIQEELVLISPDYDGSFDLQTVIANEMLCNQPNVLITPHNAFNSEEALKRIIDTGIENIKACLEKNPINLVPTPARKKKRS